MCSIFRFIKIDIHAELQEANAEQEGGKKRKVAPKSLSPLSKCDKDTGLPQGKSDALKQRCVEYKKES